MHEDKQELDDLELDEDSPEMTEVHRQIQEDKEKFRIQVLENPLDALKPASMAEVREGLNIVSHDLRGKMRPQESAQRVADLAKEIIKYKTGKDVEEGHQAWDPSAALFLRETLWQQGIVPREFLPTKSERVKVALGENIGLLKATIPRPSDFKEVFRATEPKEPKK